MIKAFLKSRFSHSSDASTLKRHISDVDSCLCCHSDALAADPIVCCTTCPCSSRSDACLPILVDQTAATEKVSYQSSPLRLNVLLGRLEKNCYLCYHVIAPNKEGGGVGGGGHSFICFGSSGSEGLTRSHNRVRRM